MPATERALALCLLLPLASAPAVAEEGGFLRFLLAEPAPVAASDPRWSYTLQRYLERDTAAPPPPTVTGSLRPEATGAPKVSPARRSRDAHIAAHESITGPGHRLSGLASFYWQPQMTANGEVFDPRQMTAAHNTLPFGTKVRVTDVRTGRSVVVRINDRGPYKPGRIIDLSQAAAQKIGMSSVGITPVKLEVVER